MDAQTISGNKEYPEDKVEQGKKADTRSNNYIWPRKTNLS
jgi:hypothetical protein